MGSGYKFKFVACESDLNNAKIARHEIYCFQLNPA
jgi:hypothetical protein